MKIISAVALLLLLLVAVDAHGHQTRRLLVTANDNAGSNDTEKVDRNVHGRKFDFSRGEAKGFLASLGSAKVDKILETSGFRGSAAKLSKYLEQDADLGIDTVADALIYACEGMAVTSPAGVAAPNEVLAGSDPTTADPSPNNAWSLSSRATATKKIWLDFKGGSVTNTAWKPNGTVTWPAYDTDGNPAAFSTTELQNIVAIWRAVSEDYAPFNVDVTTIDPRSTTANSNYMRVAIGGSSTLLNMQGGGVAYVGVFGRSDLYYQPAFVFPNMLGTGFPKYVWEAVSHEVGHTMGLQHDGRTFPNGTSEGYYAGQNGWAPVMGVGYYQPLTQWSKGEYLYANMLQDDLAIIAGKLGYTPAGNGNSLANATALVPSVTAGSATASAVGIISGTGVADYFSIQANQGTLSVAVQVLVNWGTYTRTNLDAAITVYNANGVLVGTLNPDGYAVTTTVVLPADGTYYIAVKGGSKGDATTGWTDYASLGQFNISVTYPVLASPSPSPRPSPSLSPSPSPRPSPSPSPRPSSTADTMAASALQFTKVSVTRRLYNCSVSFTLVATSGQLSGQGLGGAVVGYRWSGTTATTATTSTAQNTLGALSLSRLSNSTLGSCTIWFKSVALSGYVMDWNTLPATHTW